MMFSSIISRFIHTSRKCWSADKSQLAALRKKTGYTFANCKKALELHDNNIAQAETWLKDQAQAMSWSKATKLEGRQTKQGLIGLIVHEHDGAMVELSCETDFVARNRRFQDMAEKVARSCLNYATKQQPIHYPITKVAVNQEQLKSLPADDGKPLSGHLALLIGSVGENASLKRAFCYKTGPELLLTGYTHPASTTTPENPEKNPLLGKFGTLLVYKSTTGERNSSKLQKLGRELCQHIVGMNPKKIGNAQFDKPAQNSEDETCLIYQDFLLDETRKVDEILKENSIEIIDFKRFECGEQIDDELIDIGQKVELVETCQ